MYKRNQQTNEERDSAMYGQACLLSESVSAKSLSCQFEACKRRSERKHTLLGALCMGWKHLWLFLGLLVFSACSTPSIWDEGDALKVVCTTEMIHSLVASIGGPQIQTKVLIKGRLDPHSYQLVKGDGAMLDRADLIFSNGLGLEHGPSLRSYLKESSKNIPLGDRVYLREPERFLEVEGLIDPHFWMDMSLFILATHDIERALIQELPSYRDLFTERGRTLRVEVLKRHDEFVKLMQTLPPTSRYLVTSHDAFSYFAGAYLREVSEKTPAEWLERVCAPEGLAPESQISVGQIGRVADYLQAHHVSVIFAEANVNTDALKKLMQVMTYRRSPIRLSCRHLYGDSMWLPPSEGQEFDPRAAAHKSLEVLKGRGSPSDVAEAGMHPATAGDELSRSDEPLEHACSAEQNSGEEITMDSALLVDQNALGEQQTQRYLYYVGMIEHNVKTLYSEWKRELEREEKCLKK